MILQQKLKNVLGYNGSEGKQIKITRINFLATLEKKNTEFSLLPLLEGEAGF